MMVQQFNAATLDELDEAVRQWERVHAYSDANTVIARSSPWTCLMPDGKSVWGMVIYYRPFVQYEPPDDVTPLVV